MKYKFYSKNDKNKEAISKVEAKNYKEALTYFSEKKKLSILMILIFQNEIINMQYY